MRPALANAMKTLAQWLAILWLALILGIIAHKANHDVSRLAERYSGGEFFVELARYFIGNLAGGGRPRDEQSSR